jgi:glyoxylase-like metal-dependent hydrolase (beta-lactamase superfamily II)
LDLNFVPPAFGITAIGASHGFDCQESTSGFIIWIDGRGVMIDPPPFTGALLQKQGISSSLVDKLILTHCHADHDAGTLHKLIESTPVEFISTKTIMDSFIRKFSAQCGVEDYELEQLF